MLLAQGTQRFPAFPCLRNIFYNVKPSRFQTVNGIAACDRKPFGELIQGPDFLKQRHQFIGRTMLMSAPKL